jgi:polyketide cyclase/dehydrase/lipid transport protein
VTLHVESSEVIDHPIDRVFRFFAVDHVRNHPRWDPDVELWLDSDSPIDVGTIIHRRNKRSGTPIEGTMQVVEFEPNRAMATIIREGPVEMRSRATFEAITDNQTRLTIIIDIPGMDENADKEFLNRVLERNAQIRKQLMDADN